VSPGGLSDHAFCAPIVLLKNRFPYDAHCLAVPGLARTHAASQNSSR
jgi:hypothetical protein